MTMKIYITGVDGLLGTALAALHESLGHRVYGCDNAGWPILHGTNLDIRDEQALRAHMHRVEPDRVYHCAAMLGVQNTEANPDLCTEFNVRGTKNVVDAVNSLDGCELVFTSSSEVYGKGEEGVPFSENSPLNGDNVYAVSKIEGERLVNRLASYDRNKVVTCRMFNCYGPWQVAQFVIPRFVKQSIKKEPLRIYGSPLHSRSYLFSLDAAYYLKEVADKADSGSIVNIAHDTPRSLGEVAELVADACPVGRPDIIVESGAYPDREASRDIPYRSADLTLLHSIASHRDTVGLEAGIQSMFMSYQTLRSDWGYERQ